MPTKTMLNSRISKQTCIAPINIFYNLFKTRKIMCAALKHIPHYMYQTNQINRSTIEQYHESTK